MTQQLLSATPASPSKYKIAAQIAVVVLAYFASAKLGLAIPYMGSHITLIWLPTGIAVAALMRWGDICSMAIFLGAWASNFSIDFSLLLDSFIALGDTLAPLLINSSVLEWSGTASQYDSVGDCGRGRGAQS